jgi:hypothetical protein
MQSYLCAPYAYALRIITALHSALLLCAGLRVLAIEVTEHY